MTAELLKEAIKKLEEAQETLRVSEEAKPLEFIINSQMHYEIGTALSTLRYTLSKL